MWLKPQPTAKYGPPGKGRASCSAAARTASAGSAVDAGEDERAEDEEL